VICLWGLSRRFQNRRLSLFFWRQALSCFRHTIS
jgi:hypothetical protein